MSSVIKEVYSGAVKLLTSGPPKPLVKLLRGLSNAWELEPPATGAAFWKALSASGPNDEIRLDFHACLARWDYTPHPVWANGTPASTTLRRQAIYRLLGLDENEKVICDDLFPYAPALDAVTLITEPGAWRHWYTSERQ